jgi:hypothetical protein
MSEHLGESGDHQSSDFSHHRHQMNPSLVRFATSPLATLLQLMVTAIAIPVMGYIGGKSIDELVSLNRAVARIETTNATIEQRTRSLEAVSLSHEAAIAILRDKSIRHDVQMENMDERFVTKRAR